MIGCVQIWCSCSFHRNTWRGIPYPESTNDGCSNKTARHNTHSDSVDQTDSKLCTFTTDSASASCNRGSLYWIKLPFEYARVCWTVIPLMHTQIPLGNWSEIWHFETHRQKWSMVHGIRNLQRPPRIEVFSSSNRQPFAHRSSSAAEGIICKRNLSSSDETNKVPHVIKYLLELRLEFYFLIAFNWFSMSLLLSIFMWSVLFLIHLCSTIYS